MKQSMQTAMIIAEAVRLCRVGVIAASSRKSTRHLLNYLRPTHFLSAQNDSEALSFILGVTMSGTRAFTTITSSHLLAMSEVLFNAAELRLPIVMLCVNDSQQEGLILRDAGWLQFYRATPQGIVDAFIQAYRIAEYCELPIMICIDDDMLSNDLHSVDIPDPKLVDKFLPLMLSPHTIDSSKPVSLVNSADDNRVDFLETAHHSLVDALSVINTVEDEYKQLFGITSTGVLQSHQIADAQTIVVGLGAMMQEVNKMVDSLTTQYLVGTVRLCSYRPFPSMQLVDCIKNSQRIIVVETAASVSHGGILANEIRALLQRCALAIPVYGVVLNRNAYPEACDQIKQIIQQTDDSQDRVRDFWLGKPKPLMNQIKGDAVDIQS